MKLVRATCDCGFVTRKARSGYHHYHWWFPVLCRSTGALTDVERGLPSDDQDLVSSGLYMQLCWPLRQAGDKAAEREARAEVERRSAKILDDFFSRASHALREEYASQASEYVFDPPLGVAVRCPGCGNDTLIVDQVLAIAFCKTDCGHEYRWPDSEERGCPKCGHRPHRFQTESEDRFAGQIRTRCSCPCSSTTDCTSHEDGYCPKCGELPTSYSIEGSHYCGRHHEQLLPYRLPKYFLFSVPRARWAQSQFRNAKLWGEAPEGKDCFPGFYCAACEADHQEWSRLHDE